MRKILIGLLALGSASSFASDIAQYGLITISDTGEASAITQESIDCNFQRTPVFLTMILGNIEYTRSSEVVIGTYSSISSSEDVIYTHGLATCSSISTTSEDQTITLAHNWVGHQDLGQTTDEILSSKRSVNNAVLLLSYSDTYFSSKLFKKARDEEYNSSICNLKAKYPQSKLLIIKSIKNDDSSGSDSLIIRRVGRSSINYTVQRDRRENGLREVLRVNYDSQASDFKAKK